MNLRLTRQFEPNRKTSFEIPVPVMKKGGQLFVHYCILLGLKSIYACLVKNINVNIHKYEDY